MIDAQPSAAFTAWLTGAPAGLVGTLTAQIERADGTTDTAPATTGIVEVEPGIYVATRVAPAVSGTYMVVWNNAGTRTGEELRVGASLPAVVALGGGAMDTFDQQVARLRNPQQGGFSVSAGIAGQALNRGIRRIAVRSKSVLAEVDLGPGVLNQYLYTLAPDVVEVQKLRVNGDPKFDRVSTSIHWELLSGDANLPPGRSGAFSPRFDPDGTQKIGVFPASAADDEITGLCAMSTPDYTSTQRPPLPVDLEDAVQWAAKATLYEEVDEDLAASGAMRAAADAAAEEYRRSTNSRIGSGPIQGQIKGVHFA